MRRGTRGGAPAHRPLRPVRWRPFQVPVIRGGRLRAVRPLERRSPLPRAPDLGCHLLAAPRLRAACPRLASSVGVWTSSIAQIVRRPSARHETQPSCPASADERRAVHCGAGPGQGRRHPFARRGRHVGSRRTARRAPVVDDDAVTQRGSRDELTDDTRPPRPTRGRPSPQGIVGLAAFGDRPHRASRPRAVLSPDPSLPGRRARA